MRPGPFKLRALYSPDSGADYELVTAPHSAVWTSAADGLEHLGPDALEEITAAGARELIASAPSPIEDAAGKLVLSDDWRFVTVLRAQDAPAVGEDVRLEFDGFSVRAVTEYAGKSENGERAVVFVSDELPPGAIELRRSAARIVSRRLKQRSNKEIDRMSIAENVAAVRARIEARRAGAAGAARGRKQDE